MIWWHLNHPTCPYGFKGNRGWTEIDLPLDIYHVLICRCWAYKLGMSQEVSGTRLSWLNDIWSYKTGLVMDRFWFSELLISMLWLLPQYYYMYFEFWSSPFQLQTDFRDLSYKAMMLLIFSSNRQNFETLPAWSDAKAICYLLTYLGLLITSSCRS